MTVPKATRELLNATDLCERPGTGSRGERARWCLTNVCQNTSVVRMHQAGLMEVILQWLMVLFHVKSASIGPLVAVSGLKISGFATAVVSLCTSCLQHVTAACGTVGTADKVNVSKSLSLIPQLAICFIWKAFSFTNRNYNRIPESDWLSVGPIWTLIEQFTRHTYVIGQYASCLCN